MSFVNVAPQLVSTAAADAARIGSAINTANTAAAATTQVLAAAQDEVSTAIAALFGSHGQHYQAISAQVAAYQQRFVLALSQAGSTYAVAEAASATPLQNVLDAINAPVQSLTGRPLIGDGANGIDGTGQEVGLRHCPFLELAETQAGVVCPVHLGIMRGALQTWGAPVTVDRLDAFVEPDLCLAHFTPLEGAIR